MKADVPKQPETRKERGKKSALFSVLLLLALVLALGQGLLIYLSAK